MSGMARAHTKSGCSSLAQDLPRRKSGSAGAGAFIAARTDVLSSVVCLFRPASMSALPPASGARAGCAERKSSSESDDIAGGPTLPLPPRPLPPRPLPRPLPRPPLPLGPSVTKSSMLLLCSVSNGARESIF